MKLRTFNELDRLIEMQDKNLDKLVNTCNEMTRTKSRAEKILRRFSK